MSLNENIMKKVLDLNQKKIKESQEGLEASFREIIDKQNEVILALITNYELQVQIAKKVGAFVPKPRLNMTVEE